MALLAWRTGQSHSYSADRHFPHQDGAHIRVGTRRNILPLPSVSYPQSLSVTLRMAILRCGTRRNEALCTILRAVTPRMLHLVACVPRHIRRLPQRCHGLP